MLHSHAGRQSCSATASGRNLVCARDYLYVQLLSYGNVR
jgi:hypothetical protein